MLESFSINSEYVVESIPNIGYFQKRSWINAKLEEFNSKNALVVIKNDKILWSLLEEDEKFWLPYEKGQFFLSLFDQTKNPKIIIEQTGSDECVYYGFVDDFLISYAPSFAKCLDGMEQYCEGSKIKIFGIGSVERKCNIVISFDEIEKKLGLKKNDIDDELIYIKEEDDEYDLKNKSNELFSHWFKNKDKINLRSRKLLIVELIIFFMLSVCSCYFYCQNKQILKEIDRISKKLNN